MRCIKECRSGFAECGVSTALLTIRHDWRALLTMTQHPDVENLPLYPLSILSLHTALSFTVSCLSLCLDLVLHCILSFTVSYLVFHCILSFIVFCVPLYFVFHCMLSFTVFCVLLYVDFHCIFVFHCILSFAVYYQSLYFVFYCICWFPLHFTQN